MLEVSVVIITKNEACNIVACIATARKISTDIIVVDSGSTDGTAGLAAAEGVPVHSIAWQGYGHARNTGARLARYNWIFSLDADERITDECALQVNNHSFTDNQCIYGFTRVNYFGGRVIRHGSFAHDRVCRLYNRQTAQWNLQPVHEQLSGNDLKKTMMGGCLEHYTARSKAHYQQKITGYAMLSALDYHQRGKKWVTARRLLSPVFTFIKDYVFQLGFLEKQPGFMIARLNAFYTKKKYQALLALKAEQKKQSGAPLLQTRLRKILSFLS